MSNYILDDFSTFEAQYAIELLQSLGSIFINIYLSNDNLRKQIINLAKRDAKCFYQLAYHAYKQLQLNNSFDLLSIFNDEKFNEMQSFLQENEKPGTYYVPTVHVTPNSVRLMPLEETQGHRVLRHKSFNGINDFCLVYLKPNSGSKYINKCPRYKQLFESGLVICNHRYHLFGLSNSQLREHSYWFIRANSFEEIEQKRKLLIKDSSHMPHIGKYVSRFGLWFSKSSSTRIQLDYVENVEEFNHRIEQGDTCVTKIDDIHRNGYDFTDGCGLISKGLARLISKRLGYLVKFDVNQEFYPSGYQIRMAGCKGFVIIDPESTIEQFYIKIRDSMKKFDYDSWDLDICDYSRPIPTRLNNQIIILMSDLGISDSVFLNLQDQWFGNKNQHPNSKEDLLKNKIPLPSNECRYIFGCALESRLKAGQCYIRYTVLDEESNKEKKPEFKTVVGPVIVTKNPCPYAGDIMTLEAVDLPELDCLHDVIVFSTEGDRPDFNEIAGSDLDGDQYFVYWGNELKLLETVEPLEYKSQSSNNNPPSFTAKDFINYCYSSLGATSFGEIYNLHAIVVDKNKENHSKRTCQKLAIEMANMFSIAIDASKTGCQVDRERIKQIRKIMGYEYPDFLMKTKSYQSESILGILYRRALEYKKNNPKSFQKQDNEDQMVPFTKSNERNFRFYVKVRTLLNIDPAMIHQELKIVFGDSIPSSIIIDKWWLYYKEKQTDTASNESTDEAYSGSENELSRSPSV